MTPANATRAVRRLFLSRFELLDKVGEGAMGTVYRALDKRCDRIVALKVLHRELLDDMAWVKRFFAEARACAKLSHPNTILVLDCGVTDGGLPYIAMEYLGGRSLRQVLEVETTLSCRRTLRIIAQCCASLAEAHKAGIIHRDIKPENVFLADHFGSPDHVKLLDFSIAKADQDTRLTMTGQVLGTPQYMGPDHLTGKLDARTDLYSLGIVAYEMITGKVPWNDSNMMLMLQRHMLEPVPPLPADTPELVSSIVMRALAKEPDDRFASAVEMLEHCQDAVARLGSGGASADNTPRTTGRRFLATGTGTDDNY